MILKSRDFKNIIFKNTIFKIALIKIALPNRPYYRIILHIEITYSLVTRWLHAGDILINPYTGIN